jgi:hypothetical protein
MIVRRLSQSFKEQNWMAIAIEFVLLVSGVFLGIQVANWNADRQDQKREAEFIARLSADFDKIDARLVDNIDRWEIKATAPLRVLDDVKAFRAQGVWPRSNEAILSDLASSFDGRIPAPRAATYVELLSAGELGLIRDTKLRDTLLDYDMAVGYAQTAYNILTQRVAPHMDTLATHLQYNPNADRSVSALYAKGGRNWTRLDLQGLAADPKTDLALNMYAAASLNQLLVAKMQQQKALAVTALLKPDAIRKPAAKP